jgi:hypothetical protein
VAYVLFADSIDPDQVEFMDGELFLNGTINVKHAQQFDESEKADFKQKTEPPTV